MTGGQALNVVFVLNQETYGLLDKIPLKTRRLHGELKYCAVQLKIQSKHNTLLETSVGDWFRSLTDHLQALITIQ